MTREREGLKPSVDWGKVEERAEMFLVYSLIVVGGGLVGIIAICCMALMPLLGICLTLQGWWGIGIPITIAGAVLDVAALALLFAKLMVFIKEMRADDY